MPDATVGEYYEESATFHLPPIVVDPGSGLTVDFLSMTVMTVEGLPAGLVFTPNILSGEYCQPAVIVCVNQRQGFDN